MGAFSDVRSLHRNEEYADGQGIHLLNRDKARAHFFPSVYIIF